MTICDIITEFIHELLEDADGSAELQRRELACRFGCVPSQINYVISTRFSPEHGYLVESRRGGGGYIRITRLPADSCQMLMHTINAVSDSIDYRTAHAFLSNLLQAEVIEQKTAHLIISALQDHTLKVLPPNLRDVVRASILKQMLLTEANHNGKQD